MKRSELDALFGRERITQAQYLERLARERAYLQGEIDKLAGRTGRHSAIRAELEEALIQSHVAEEAILEGDWIYALEVRDRMHIKLHLTKLFDWQPLLKDGMELAPYRKSKSTGRANFKKQSDANREEANDRVRKDFRKYVRNLSHMFDGLSQAQILERYVIAKRIRRQLKVRLEEMLEAGTLFP